MQFSREIIERGGCLTITIPKHIVKYYDVNVKDLVTLDFVRNLRDGKDNGKC